MTIRIGIICTNRHIGAAVNRGIIKNTRISDPRDHHDLTLYYSDFSHRLDPYGIYEPSRVMLTLGVTGGLVFPDRNIRDLSRTGMLNVVPILLPDENLPTIEDVSQIRLIEAWARFIGRAVINHEKHVAETIAPVQEIIVPARLRSDCLKPSRHKKGLVGIIGGMPTESGQQMWEFVIDECDTPVILRTDSKIVNPIATGLRLAGKERLIESMLGDSSGNVPPSHDSLPHLQDTWNKMLRIGAVPVISCNTIHFDFPWLARGSLGINIVKEGVRAVPPNSHPLVLATSASVEMGIFEKAARSLGRVDINFLYPNEEMQGEVSKAIWEITMGNTPQGRDKLEKVVRAYEEEMGPNPVIICGCTEIIRGVSHLDGYLLINNAEIGARAAIKKAQETVNCKLGRC